MSDPEREVLAAVDVGTNSVRLLVGDGARDLVRDLTITRLGEGVDAARTLQPEPMRRTIEAIERYVAIARDRGATRIRIAATSAVRDAANRGDFVAAVRGATAGIEPDVLSGDEEARVTFAGVAAGLEEELGAGLDASTLKAVVDIGGGSTEIVAGRNTVLAAISMDVGSVRLTERHVRSDPPAAAEIAAVRDAAEAVVAGGWEAVRPALGGERPVLVGVAGTITSMAAIALGLPGYDRDAIHGARLARSTVGDVTERLAAMTSEARRALPAMPRGREDVIVAGAILLGAVMDAAGASEVVVSERDILDGLLASLAR